MSQTGRSAFWLKLGSRGDESLAVTSFSGTEELSRPFDFSVEFFPVDGQPLEPAELLGESASLGLQVAGGSPRHVHGQVHRVEALGPRGGWPRYRVRVVPALVRLEHVRRSRIFQEKTTPDIVKQILSEASLEHRWAAGGSYAVREYCVQYRETDLDFISRLLEWEGLFYFFEHSEVKHVLVVGDDASAFRAMAGGARLPFRERTGQMPKEEHVWAFARVRRVRPAAVMARDFDFKKPALDLTGRMEGEGFTGLELYDYPEGYTAPGEGKRLAKVRLEEAQREAHTHAGESACPRLCPGVVFGLEEPAPPGVVGKYLTVRVRHSGSQPEMPGAPLALEEGLYRNEVGCLPEGGPFRPQRRTRWPVVPGIQTATVVGPEGEEIHPDAHGRIKVQFHWDREGKRNEKSSCWIRVGQVWGGPAWGGLFLPRIGQEVVVRFLEGNPDRPLITGAVYNGKNATPCALPDEKTKSTLKSSSSLGGDGSNELRIEDAAGSEEIFVHAQKDETLRTKNDKAQEVRGNEALRVKKDRKITVEGNQRLEILQHDVGLVEQDQTLQVTGNRETGTSGSHDEEVTGDQSLSVAKQRRVSVAQAASTDVGGAGLLGIGGGHSVNVALAMSEAVGGTLSERVAGNSMEFVVEGRSETVEEDRSSKIGAQHQVEVAGQVITRVGRDLQTEVDGRSQLRVKVGMAWLAGRLALKADRFHLVVNDKLILSLEQSGKVELHANSVSLDGSAIRFKGTKIKKEPSGSMSSKSLQWDEIESPTAPGPGTAEFKLEGPDGTAVSHASYEITLADGTVRKGKTDGSGKTRLDKVPSGGFRVNFPEVVGSVRKK